MFSLLLAALIPLEWSANNDTSISYELELNPTKLEKLGCIQSGTGFQLRAKTENGEIIQPVSTYAGRLPNDIGLRFSVPHGTTKLQLETGIGARSDVDSAKLDNLLGSWNSIANWRLPKGVKASVDKGGILFETIGYTDEFVEYSAIVPEQLRGKPIKLELDLESLTPMSWGSYCQVLQYDSMNNLLPEDVVDPRWISHMRPQNYLTAYKEKGRLHPLASKVVVRLELRSVEYAVDAYGLPRKDKDQSRARLRLTRLALRAAGEIPFPGLDNSYFVRGIMGSENDSALVLGGTDERAFFYATHSQASWAQHKVLRDEKLYFYPDRAGTIEAWFRPDWDAFARKSRGNRCRLFSTDHNYKATEWKRGMGTVLELAYEPKTKHLSLNLKDMNGKDFKASTTSELKNKVWTHIAVQFEPNGKAEVFVGGKRVLATSLAGYVALDAKDATIKYPNDQMHMEFFLGSCQAGARASFDVLPAYPLFEGAADLLRVSSGCRYASEFSPKTTFDVDTDTRALFTFDRTFDGISGGGIGYIRGTTRSMGAGRVSRKLVIDDKIVQYYPEQIADYADPSKVLDVNNYKEVPQAEDFKASWVPRSINKLLSPGDKFEIQVKNRVATDCIRISNRGKEPLLYPIILGRDDLDVRSFADAADSLAIGGLADRERANRLFQFVIGASDYFMDHTCSFIPGTDISREELGLPMVMLNAYCGFECGPLNNLTANLFACAVCCPAGQTVGYGHSFEQVFYDGKNHTYDLAAQSFFPAMDNETAATLGESEDETGSHHRIRKSPDHFTRRSLRPSFVQNPGYQEKMGVVLNPGESFRVWFANNGELNDVQHIPPASFGPDQSTFPNMPWLQDYTERLHGDPKSKKIYRVNRFFPDYANGFIEFNGRPTTDNPAFTSLQSDSFCYVVKSSFPIVFARYAAKKKNGCALPLKISTDRGKTFRELPMGDLRYEVRARYEYLIKVPVPMSDVAQFSALTEVMVNRRVFPGRLKLGMNELRLRAASKGSAEVQVAWREQAEAITFSQVASSGTLVGFERQLAVVEPGKPLELKVGGVSSHAMVMAESKLDATLVNGVLKISSKVIEPCFSSLTVKDGSRTKQLTVLICKGARFAFAREAELSGGAALLQPDSSSDQSRVVLKTLNDKAKFKFERLPAGRYMVYQLERFEGGLPSFNSSWRPLVFEDPAKPGEKILAGGTNAIQHDFMKAPSGKTGGRSAFKWDAPSDQRRTYHVSWLSRRFDMPEFDHLEYSLIRNIPLGVEVAAVLIVPDPDEELYCQLEKILCGMNCNPWNVK